jgi:hypothetical protein
MSYTHLTLEERYVIYHLVLYGLSLREIGARFGDVYYALGTLRFGDVYDFMLYVGRRR